MSRTTDDSFDELHRILTSELIGRIKSGTASTSDLKTAADWLAKNNITGTAVVGSPLASLMDASLPELDFSNYQA